MISFMIDEITPCLKSNETGEIYETEVIQLKRKSFLTKFNKRTGWYVNWSRFEDGIEIYALVLKGTMDIQGLIAIQNDSSSKSIHIVWACTAPWNNILQEVLMDIFGVKLLTRIFSNIILINFLLQLSPHTITLIDL